MMTTYTHTQLKNASVPLLRDIAREITGEHWLSDVDFSQWLKPDLINYILQAQGQVPERSYPEFYWDANQKMLIEVTGHDPVAPGEEPVIYRTRVHKWGYKHPDTYSDFEFSIPAEWRFIDEYEFGEFGIVIEQPALANPLAGIPAFWNDLATLAYISSQNAYAFLNSTAYSFDWNAYTYLQANREFTAVYVAVNGQVYRVFAIDEADGRILVTTMRGNEMPGIEVSLPVDAHLIVFGERGFGEREFTTTWTGNLAVGFLGRVRYDFGDLSAYHTVFLWGEHGTIHWESGSGDSYVAAKLVGESMLYAANLLHLWGQRIS